MSSTKALPDTSTTMTTTAVTQTQPPTTSSSSSNTSAESTAPNAHPRGTAEFVEGNTLVTRFTNFYRMATGRMSGSGEAAYWRDADERYESMDCRRCESQRDFLLQHSPTIGFLSERIAQLGGRLDRTNIRCRRCEPHERMLGGFDPHYGIKLCANVLDGSRSRVEDTLAHEMVHAWDHLRWKVNWDGVGGDLRGIACTEIRASSLSGECRWANEFFGNKIFKFMNHHQDCVRRRAVQSVRSRPQCKSDLDAVTTVNEVWDSCFRDTRPFDEIFR